MKPWIKIKYGKYSWSEISNPFHIWSSINNLYGNVKKPTLKIIIHNVRINII